MTTSDWASRAATLRAAAPEKGLNASLAGLADAWEGKPAVPPAGASAKVKRHYMMAYNAGLTNRRKAPKAKPSLKAWTNTGRTAPTKH